MVIIGHIELVIFHLIEILIIQNLILKKKEKKQKLTLKIIINSNIE